MPPKKNQKLLVLKPSSRQVVNSLVRTKQVSVPVVQTATRRRSRRAGARTAKPATTMNRYLATLRDPWVNPPMRLGWGSFMPSSIRTAFTRQEITLSGTNKSFLVALFPWNAATSFVTPGNAYLTSYFFPNGTTAVASAASTVSNTSYNQAMLTSVVNDFRVVSSSLRAVVRYPLTSVRGSLHGLHVHDSYATLDAQTLQSLQNLYASVPSHGDSGGQIGTDVQYRPLDASSFLFLGTAPSSVAAKQPMMLVSGTGWPEGSVLEVFTVTHMETISGFDAAGEDTDDGPSLSSEGITQDEAGHAASSIPPVISSINVMDMLDSAMNTIMTGVSRFAGSSRSSLRGGPQPQMEAERFLVAPPTSPAVAPAAYYR
jgi:hypothetical protein